MKNIKHFDFFRTKYGEELLIDIVELKHIKKYFANNPFHSLGYYDVTLVIEGEGEFRIDSKGYHAKPGDVLFSCPRHIRAWNTEKISNGYALIFEGEFLLNFFNDRNFLKDISYFNCNFENKNKLSLNNEDYTRIANLIFDIKREIDTYKNKDKHILRALLYQFLKLLDRIYKEQTSTRNNKPKRNRYVERFLELVDAEYINHHYIKYYAERLCLTADHLTEVVKEATGYNAKEIIKYKLLNDAKLLLLYTSSSVKKISSDLNYENPTYFIRVFKKQTGYTPTQFRNMNKP